MKPCVEIFLQVGRGLIAFGATFGKALEADAFEFLGHAAIELTQWFWIVRLNLVK